MKVVSFIERRQSDVTCLPGRQVERILRHCGLWEGPLRTHAGPRPPPNGSPAEPRDLELVPDGEFLESEHRESQADGAGELQFVLDPDLL